MSYKEEEGIFSPIFIASIMSLGQLLPQLTTIYSLPTVYDTEIIPPLVITMILCNWAFYKGWKNKLRKKKSSKVLEFKSSYYKPLTLIFSLGAVVFTQIIKLGSAVIDGVIAFQFQGIGFIGLIMAILYLKNNKVNRIILFSLILSTYSILEYALTIYGSRQSIFTTVLLYIYLLWYKIPNKRKILKKSFLTFFSGLHW
ncbi:MAG: hypothetical protein LUD00_03540 [Prevotellaceae bacterium]|nr:hypothetical protein [Prevotellaceae bacterium]